MADDHDVVIVGAGQAGLSISHELTGVGRSHIVLERGRLGQTWRDRWDSFCLVLPNWTVQLAGEPYVGADPDGFMVRDDVVDYLARYAAAVDATGFPIQQDGTSTVVPGLHFIGLPFGRTRASASLLGVGDDAQVLAERMAHRQRVA